MTKKSYMEVARDLADEHFKEAKCVLVAGSVIHGEATATSDIDMVVIYDNDKLERSYRDTIFYQDWLVETFVQRVSANRYFIDSDIRSGRPILIDMVMNGILIKGEEKFVSDLKAYAAGLMEKGPPPLSQDVMERMRYFITDSIDDIRDYKNKAELYGSLSLLHSDLAGFYLKANGKWAGRGKSTDRELRRSYPELASRYEKAFTSAFTGDVKGLVALAEEMLAPFGGFLMEGWKQYAPEEADKYEESN